MLGERRAKNKSPRRREKPAALDREWERATAAQDLPDRTDEQIEKLEERQAEESARREYLKERALSDEPELPEFHELAPEPNKDPDIEP